MSAPALLVVDDDRLFCQSLVDCFEGLGVDASYVTSYGDAVNQPLERFAVVVVDNHLPDGEGLALVDAAAGSQRGPSFIMVTGDPSYDHAVAAMRRRVVDYLAKPIELDALVHAVQRAVVGAVAPAAVRQDGSEPLEPWLARYAASDVPILITGETGTGKSRLAKRLHAASGRAEGPFLSVDCAALAESIAEAELFGARRGAFTGATERAGLVAMASGGTLFLDEIGELSPTMQAKLLSVLEQQRVRPLGGTHWTSVDLRIIAATHVELEVAVDEGRFRSDLLYRLDVGRVSLPPLREQPLRLEAAVAAVLEELGAPPSTRLRPGELAALARHDWPGNFRELRNVLARALVLHAPEPLRPSECLRPRPSSKGSDVPLATLTLAELERRHVLEVLDAQRGHRGRTARVLGISEATLRRKLRAWSMDSDRSL